MPDETKGACFACGVETQFLCPTCEQFFCINHTAIFNKRLCMKCGPCTLQVETSEGITGKNGEQHQGRRFKLIGEGWPNEIEKIQSLTDIELDDKLFYYQNLLKEVVRSRDTLMITVSALENESIGRKVKKARGTGTLTSGLSFTPSTDRVVKTKTAVSGEEAAIAKLAKTLGVDIEKATRVYKKLKDLS